MNKLKQLIRLAMVSNHGADSAPITTQQIKYHGKIGNSTSWYPYGLHSVAKDGSLCLVLSPNGNSEERIHIPTSMPDRPQGKPGEVFLFHPDSGSVVKLGEDGTITITAASDLILVSPTKIELDAPTVDVLTNLAVSGDADITGTLDAAGITSSAGLIDQNGIEMSTHEHIANGTGNPTDGPQAP